MPSPPKPAYIVFGSPVITQAEIDAMTRTLQTNWIGTGPRVHEFQTQFAAYVGAKYGCRDFVLHRHAASRDGRFGHRPW